MVNDNLVNGNLLAARLKLRGKYILSTVKGTGVRQEYVETQSSLPNADKNDTKIIKPIHDSFLGTWFVEYALDGSLVYATYTIYRRRLGIRILVESSSFSQYKEAGSLRIGKDPQQEQEGWHKSWVHGSEVSIKLDEGILRMELKGKCLLAIGSFFSYLESIIFV